MGDSSTQEKDRPLSRSEVDGITTRYIMAVDKWRRMLEGMASELERYENGIIYLNVKNTGEKRPSSFEMAIEFARSWVQWNAELKDAKGFVAVFYTSRSTGFMVDADAVEKTGVINNLVQQLLSSDKVQPQLINIFAGLLTHGVAEQSSA